MMTLVSLMLLMVCSAVLWWRLSCEQKRNALLTAELVRLRGKLRLLRND